MDAGLPPQPFCSSADLSSLRNKAPNSSDTCLPKAPWHLWDLSRGRKGRRKERREGDALIRRVPSPEPRAPAFGSRILVNPTVSFTHPLVTQIHWLPFQLLGALSANHHEAAQFTPNKPALRPLPLPGPLHPHARAQPVSNARLRQTRTGTLCP